MNIFHTVETLVQDKYKLESIGVSKWQILSAAGKRALKIHQNTTRRLPNGQFEVGLLWRSDEEFLIVTH